MGYKKSTSTPLTLSIYTPLSTHKLRGLRLCHVAILHLLNWPIREWHVSWSSNSKFSQSNGATSSSRNPSLAFHHDSHHGSRRQPPLKPSSSLSLDHHRQPLHLTVVGEDDHCPRRTILHDATTEPPFRCRPRAKSSTATPLSSHRDSHRAWRQ